MKNLRKILCCILPVLMLSGMLLTAPATANAAETNIQEVGATYSGTTGSCTWNLDTTTGVLKISGTGAMGNYSSSTGSPWYSYRSYVKTVTISNGVTSIGNYAFFYCTSLTSVTIPSSITSIGDAAFYKCTSLTSLTIPSSVTSIGSYTFYNCTSLTSVTIPSSVTSIGSNAFLRCTGLTSISVNSNNTKYSSIDGNLYNKNQTELIQYAIGKTATSFTILSSITSIDTCAFCGCTSLSSINVNSNNTRYSSINGNLYNKDQTELIQYAIGKTATSFTIPSSVTSIGRGAFDSSTSLTSVTIPNSVTSIGRIAFQFCASLTSIEIPDSVTSIDAFAFNYCTSLKSITIPSSVTSIGEIAFQHCDSLTSIVILNGITSIEDYTFNYCTSLTSVTIPSSVTSIKYRAFANCTSLTSVTIPSSVTSIGNYSFYNCSKLKTVYYTGTASDWSNISIGTNNAPLTDTTKYYSAQESSEPTTESTEPTTVPTTQPTTAPTQPTTATEPTKTEPTETQATQPTVCKHKSTWTRGKKTATYFEKGYTGDKICNNCGKVVSKSKPIAKKVLATPKTTIKSRGNAIVISYTKVKGAHGFEMECKFGSKKYSQKIKTTRSKTITLSNIKRGINAKIKVRAFTTSGKKKAYSNWTKTKTLKIK